MKSISMYCKTDFSDVLSNIAKERGIEIREDIREFLKKNSGGYPVKDIVTFNDEEYEVRVFLSLDNSDDNYYIEKPLHFFMDKTKGKIVPIGLDSGDNYYCVNNENGKVYYWSAGIDQYYCLAESLAEFVKAFE